MAGFSFSQQGATPQSNSNSFLGSYGSGNAFLAGQTPAGKALAGAANMSTPAGPRYAAPPVTTPMSFATPSTPVKKQVVTNTDGSTHTTEYHAPEPGLLTSTQNKDSGASQQQGFASDPAGGGGHSVISSGGLSAPATQDNTQPITGNAVTPSGATVNTSSGGLVNAPISSYPTYPGLLSSLASKAAGPSDQYTQAYNQAQDYNRQLQESRTNETNAEAQNRLNPIPIGDQTGREAVIRNQYLAQQNALAGQFQGATNLVGAANTQQGLQQSGLTSALSAAAPQLASFSQQAFNPITGQFGPGGGSLNDAVSTVVQRIQSGQMSYDQGISALGGYGQGGVNALQQALGPNFNVAQSNALAGVQGAVGPAVQYANSALDLLSDAAGKLGVLGQGSNIPFLNAAGTAVSSATGLGGDQTQAYKSAVAEARAALTNVFIQKGVTPTAAGDQANALIPDNPTPQQISAAKQTLATFGQSTQSIYGNPGAVNSNSNAQSTNNPTGWF